MNTGLVRTQYWNLGGVNETPKTGLTAKAESRTDVEGHLLASDAARNAALCTPGVAAGLQVSATVGAGGVTVAPGTAVDGAGRLVVLADGGRAVVDRQVGPGGVQNIPTVLVTATGAVLDTADLEGDLLVTVTWREVEDVDAGLLVLRQAPWLRLVDLATFVDDGLQLPLATVTLTRDGEVAGLVTGPRRLVGSTVGRLEVRRPVTAGGASAGQAAAVELAPRGDGGADLSVLPATGPPRRVLSVSGTSGDVDLGTGLSVTGATALAAGLTVSGGVEALGDVTTAGNLTAQGDLAVGGAVSAADLDVGTLAADGAANFSSSLTVGGAVSAADLDVAGTAIVGGRIGVKTSNPAFDVHVDGTACAVTFCNPSDARLKTGIAELADVGDRLGRIRAVSFAPRGDSGDADVRRQVGVLAQEVQEVFPELVLPMGENGLLAVDYAGLVGVLVGAVNELHATACALSHRLEELVAATGSRDATRR